MEDVINISRYIVSNLPVDNLKLQKLLFYTQAVSLHRTGKPAFEDEIQARHYGPLVPRAYNKYKEFDFETIIEDKESNTDILMDTDIIESIDLALSYYGDMTPAALIRQTHSESPWQDAYKKGSKTVIANDAIKSYYDQIYIIE